MRSLGLSIIVLTAAGLIAAAPSSAQQQSPCVTKSECDQRMDALDMKNRREAWDASVKREDDFVARQAQLRAQAIGRANAGSLARSRDIMHRRHVAAGNE